MKQDAGRELDARVAEKLFGWSNLRWMDNIHRVCGVPPVSFMEIPQVVPRYSESIEAAFQVVEKMRERGLSFVLEADTETTQWFAAFGDVPGCGSIADTAPLAIVGAALAAIEATEKESTLRTPEDK